ncbi:MAG: C69 family dipeptidase [Bacteroidales bacterium]|nr:C69 family dipeptidase [Bacteroidales bacterium]
MKTIGGNLVVNLHKVPGINQEDSVYLLSTGEKIAQVAKTYEMLWIETTQQKFGDFYMNEWGVTICSNACQSKENKAEGKIGYDLRKIVAERAENAREGVEIAIALINELGYESSGRTYCISDAYEVWFLAVVQGKHYVAQRLPDNAVAVIPNFYTIEEIDLSDTENFIASPDIIDYAIEQGWYNPDLGQPFNFRKAYGNEGTLISERNTYRNIAGRSAFDFSQVGAFKTSFSIKATEKVTIEDLKLVLESHFLENSELDSIKTPHNDNRHPI